MTSSRFVISSMIRAVPYVALLTLGISAYNVFTAGSREPVMIPSDRGTLSYGSAQTEFASPRGESAVQNEFDVRNQILGAENDTGTASPAKSGEDGLSSGNTAGLEFSPSFAVLGTTLNPNYPITDSEFPVSAYAESNDNVIRRSKNAGDMAYAFSSGVGAMAGHGIGLSPTNNLKDANGDAVDLPDRRTRQAAIDTVIARSSFDDFSGLSVLSGLRDDSVNALLSNADFFGLEPASSKDGDFHPTGVATVSVRILEVPDRAATLGLFVFAFTGLVAWRRRQWYE